MKAFSRAHVLASSLLVGAVLTSCASPSSGSGAVDDRLVAANMGFGFRLFARVYKQDAGENVFVSPTSVAMALDMTYNGAAGETQQAMAATLGLEGLSRQEVNQANAALQRSLEGSDPQVEIAIANSIWARQGVAFKTDFLERGRQFFGAEIATLDFGDPQASRTINRWVSTNTKGKIDRIVGEKIDRAKVMFLINAIYFKGQWAEAFDESQTREMAFHLPGGGEKQVPMMTRSGKFLYCRGDGFQAISLPYGEGGASMYVFLPAPDSNLDEFMGKLSAEAWTDWLSCFEETNREGHIALPRFKVEYEVTLNDVLEAMGMGIAFDPARANFEGMCSAPPSLYISEVKHKTFVEVNEEGTEAAAVTSVSASESVPPRFVVDRPFFFAIRDHQTGTVLFMGTIVDPG